MNIIIGAICVFGMGWMLNEFTDVPLPVIGVACFALIVALLVVNNKRKK